MEGIIILAVILEDVKYIGDMLQGGDSLPSFPCRRFRGTILEL